MSRGFLWTRQLGKSGKSCRIESPGPISNKIQKETASGAWKKDHRRKLRCGTAFLPGGTQASSWRSRMGDLAQIKRSHEGRNKFNERLFKFLFWVLFPPEKSGWWNLQVFTPEIARRVCVQWYLGPFFWGGRLMSSVGWKKTSHQAISDLDSRIPPTFAGNVLVLWVKMTGEEMDLLTDSKQIALEKCRWVKYYYSKSRWWF